MDSHFNYAHTIHVESDHESSEELDKLFKIGSNAIEGSNQKEESDNVHKK